MKKLIPFLLLLAACSEKPQLKHKIGDIVYLKPDSVKVEITEIMQDSWVIEADYRFLKSRTDYWKSHFCDEQDIY